MAKKVRATDIIQKDIFKNTINSANALKEASIAAAQALGKVGKELREQITKVVGEFSLDNDGSALSRLVGRVEQAHRKRQFGQASQILESLVTNLRVLQIQEPEIGKIHQEFESLVADLCVGEIQGE